MRPIAFSRVTFWAFLGVFLAAISSPSQGYGEENTLSSSPAISDEELCKYGSDSPKIQDTDLSPPELYQDLQKIYVVGVLQWSAEKQLAENPLFTEDVLTRLSACVLRRHLDTFGYSHLFKEKPLTVIAMTREQPVKFDEIKKDKSALYINIMVEWRNGNRVVETDAPLQEGHILTLAVQSVRGGSKPSPYAKPHLCEAEVSYSMDKEKLQKSVTDGLQKCLRERY